MAKVLAPHGVTINTMLPVMHHTPGIRAIYEAQAQARGTSYDIEVARMVKEAPIPAGRLAHAENFGTLYAMFASAKPNTFPAKVRVSVGAYPNWSYDVEEGGESPYHPTTLPFFGSIFPHRRSEK